MRSILVLTILLTYISINAKITPSFLRSPLEKINFGVLVLNDKYQIYRSGKLGESGLIQLEKHLREKGLPFPKTIIHLNSRGFSWWIDHYALDEFQMQNRYGYTFFHPYKMDYRTYLDGQNPYKPHTIIDYWTPLSQKSLQLLQIRAVENPTAEGGIDSLKRVLALILDPSRQPVLFHCDGGRHRTGMVALLIRSIQGGEWTDRPRFLIDSGALATQKRKVTTAQLEYFMHNPDYPRENNLLFVDKFTQEDPDFQQMIIQFHSDLEEQNASRSLFQ